MANDKVQGIGTLARCSTLLELSMNTPANFQLWRQTIATLDPNSYVDQRLGRMIDEEHNIWE
eukprot:11674936-Ditylum_brightwellii.AAC.1